MLLSELLFGVLGAKKGREFANIISIVMILMSRGSSTVPTN